jgi:hypothetical protein
MDLQFNGLLRGKHTVESSSSHIGNSLKGGELTGKTVTFRPTRVEIAAKAKPILVVSV